MTAFLVHLDASIERDAPAPEFWLKSVKPLAYRGPHGLETVAVDGLRISAGTRRVSQRDRTLTQPVRFRNRSCVLVFDGRLDAPEALARQLGLPASAGMPPDAELVALSYERYSLEFLARLDGEYAIVLYDSGNRTLVAARDMLGSRTLFWSRTSNGFCFSNELPAIRSLPFIDDQLDPLATADFLMFGYVDFFDKERTPFNSIKALPPSNCLIISGDQHHIRRYRTFSEWLRPVDRLKPVDVPEAFRVAMADAVTDRLDADRVLIPLSGGLDSTTIAATAIASIKSGRARARAVAYTGLAADSDPERQFAEKAAQFIGIPHCFARLKRETLLAKPVPTWYPVLEFFVNSRNEDTNKIFSGADVVIYGAAGDSLIYPERISWIEMLRRYGLRHTLHARRVLRAQGRTLSIGTGLKSSSRLGDRVRVTDGGPSHGMPEWLQKSFVDEYHLAERLEEHLHWRPADELHPVLPNVQFLLQWANWFWGYHPVGTVSTPPEWTDPFLDFRVVSLVFSLPPEPWLFRKYLLREAGRGLLPEEVLSRKKSPAGNYAAALIKELGRDVLDNWVLSDELARFIDRRAIPPIDIDIEGSNSYVNFRPMMLQRWYAGLQEW